MGTSPLAIIPYPAGRWDREHSSERGNALMFTAKNWHRVAALTAFVCALALAGCADKKNDTPKAGGDPKPAEPKGVTPPGPNPPGPTPGPTPPPKDLTKEKPEATYTMEAFLAEMIKDSNFPVSKHRG